MDISPTALVNAAVQMQQAQTAQLAQILVLKRAMDVQAAGAMALLQAVPASLPLATDGSLGTQLNLLV